MLKLLRCFGILAIAFRKSYNVYYLNSNTLQRKGRFMEIREINTSRESYMNLLLLADPLEKLVREYLERGYLFVLFDDDIPCGVIHLDPQDEGCIEIKNVAVDEPMQGRGLGTMLLRYAIAFCRQKCYKKVIIGTGNSSVGNLYLYQKVGFRIVSIKQDFFVLHYDEPIFENGIQCRDMLMLEMLL